jgi:hypothetical protein
MLQALTPKRRALSAMGHRNRGALSTVMALPESNDPKNSAFQLCDPACAAAE